jgi:HD superfamily phosphodiesterase
VVKSTKELIENSEINVKEEGVLLLSAWLHDTGNTVKFEGHEEESVKIAKQFLQDNNVDKDTIEMVSKCIMATKIEFILCSRQRNHAGRIAHKNYGLCRSYNSRENLAI